MSSDRTPAPAALRDAVSAGGLLRPGQPVVVLLSGGRDSTCLLHVATAIAGPRHTLALHVNYRLRDSADADEELCRLLCDELGVELVLHSPAARLKGNLQAWARDERYAAAARLAEARDAVVATGHTASDQVETVLHRLASSPGRRALMGMEASDGRLVRPLLGFSREATGTYCREAGLRFADDPGNASPVFSRNRIRRNLLPALREIHPAAEDNVLSTLEGLRDEADVLRKAVAEARRALGDPPSVAALAGLEPALARLVVQAMADDAVGGTAASVGARVSGILALARQGGTTGLDLPGGLRAEVTYGHLRVRPRPGRAEPPAGSARLLIPGSLEFGGGRLVGERGRFPIADGSLSAASLGAALEVRTWRPGDAMRPLGLGGSKSLQDLFTDAKVPRTCRHRLPVVLSRGEIAWIPGVATGEGFRVPAARSEHVRLSWAAPVYD